MTLMSQGQTYSLHANLCGYLMRFQDLVGMVVPTAHTTQQNFLIGSSSKIKFFIHHNADIDISVQEQYLQFWATLDDGQVWSSKISAY